MKTRECEKCGKDDLMPYELCGCDPAGNVRGPFAACPEGEHVTQLEWDIQFQSGLVFDVDAQLEQDYQLYGSCFHVLNDDGTKTRLDPTKLQIRVRAK